MLKLAEEQDIRDRTTDLITEWQIEQRGEIEEMTLHDYLDLVEAAAVAAEEGNLSLKRWVSASRRAGASWEQIGTALGVSKQAAQKRFGESFDDSVAPSEKRVRGVNAFNEVEVLADQGAAGYEVVRAGWGVLYFHHVGHAVENVRRVSLRQSSMISEMESVGWKFVFRWTPYTYYSRPAQ